MNIILPNFARKQLLNGSLQLINRYGAVSAKTLKFSHPTLSNYSRSISIPGVKTGGEKMILMFTCNVCETRSAKTISKTAYYKGVVVTICPKCKSKHLIADHHGIFEDKGWTIEEFLLKTTGQSSKIVDDDSVFELTAEDIIGSNKVINDNETETPKEIESKAPNKPIE